MSLKFLSGIDVDSNTLFVDSANDRVGIGTASPDKKLTISGPGGSGGALLSLINSTGTGSSGPSMDFNGGTAGNNHRVGSNLFVEGDFAIYDTNNTNRMFVINPSGNVGIGTTSPTRGITINKTNEFASLNIVKANTTNQIVYLGTGSSGPDDLGILQLYDGGVAKVQLYTGGNSYFTGGNVGIGTTSPSAPLHIIKDLGTSVEAVARLRNSNSTARTTRLQFEDYNGTIADGFLDFVIPTAGSSTGARLDIGVNGANISLVNGGNVGIGTTAPTSLLHIAGSPPATSGSMMNIRDNAANGSNTSFSGIFFNSSPGTDYSIGKLSSGADGFFQIRNGNNGTGYLTINNSGNVGIGTTSPSEKLHITESTSNSYATFRLEGSNRGGIIDMYQGAYPVSRYLTDQSGNIGIYTSGAFGSTTLTEKVSITTGGNVGIGTTSPSYKLDVNGTGRFSVVRSNYYDIPSGTGFNSFQMGADTSAGGWYVYNLTTGTYSLTVANSGNVGIGTTSPGYKLDVSGTIRATGDVIAYSDARVKENVKTIDGALERVLDMRGVFYNKIGEHEKKVGVIAQEIIKVLPEVVSQDETGTYSVAYGNITAVLIEAVKELSARVEFLEEKLKQK